MKNTKALNNEVETVEVNLTADERLCLQIKLLAEASLTADPETLVKLSAAMADVYTALLR